MERTRLPRGEMPSPPPPTIEEQLREKFGGEGPSCAKCFHAYAIKPMPAAEIAYQCMHSPPSMVLIPIPGGGLGAQMAPRILPAKFFCHQFTDKSTVRTEQIKVPA